jgi:hypothetical protein
MSRHTSPRLPAHRFCPVCDYGKTDTLSVKQHNEACAATGERAYPEPRYVHAPINRSRLR